ncbi:hypothetical protein FPV67DRAFT_1692541 [Lyophyllum atratum]|nr:hypothetical protein FPV67DRAFT_1692541 [Lyophyllum atratum]
MTTSEILNHAHEASASSLRSDTTTITGSPQASTFAAAGMASQFPKTIPPSSSARTLVLCFDGTGDQFDSDNSNIVEFFTMLKKDDRDKQRVYYQAEIGTYTSPQIATPLAAKFSKTLDEAVAWNLSSHVMDGNEFLMQNYKAGDRICILGFSRGAYTARGLAGMIHKQVPFAYKMFRRVDETGWKQSNAFKKTFSVDVPIEFLAPLYPPLTPSAHGYRELYTRSHSMNAVQSSLWNRPNAKESKLGVDGQKPDVPKVAKMHSYNLNKERYANGDGEALREGRGDPVGGIPS